MEDLKHNCDFHGWATKNDITCIDGLTIRKNAFKVNDGEVVPLVWNHDHSTVGGVLGHALLENRDDGVYAYCSLNDTTNGQEARKVLKHGDVKSLSIWANNLVKSGSDVLHGVIREVSLVLAGANPGAFVESVAIHGISIGEDDDEGIFYNGENIILSHSAETEKEEKEEEKEEMADEKEEKKEEKQESGKSIKEVYNAMTDEQKNAVAAMVGMAIQDSKKTNSSDNNSDEDNKEDNKEDKNEMKHNAFSADATDNRTDYISHDAMMSILKDAKRLGSLKEAVEENIQNGVLAHSIDTNGMTTATGTSTYGFNDPSMLFPDYKTLQTQPEWLSREMDWVSKLLNEVHHTPFSRIKSVYADITEDEARAKGYIKGKQKKEEVFTTLKRTTTPQTIYKKQKMDRDDIIDITDFDVVAWIKAEMRTMLDEEIARAILIGDGRSSDSDDKISEDHIRPIASDVALFNTKVPVSVSSDDTDESTAKKTINAVIKARKNYKGSGNPVFWTTEDVLTSMLLIEDGIGHKLYKTEGELATALRVKEIRTVEVMENQTVTVDGSAKSLIGIIVNMADYNVGADKGGEINMFDDFDIDYNQQKYLIETRISGALIKPYSALTLYVESGSTSNDTE